MMIAGATSNDPVGLIILGVIAAVGLVRFILWAVRPPRWQDLDSAGPPVKDYNQPWLWW